MTEKFLAFCERQTASALKGAFCYGEAPVCRENPGPSPSRTRRILRRRTGFRAGASGFTQPGGVNRTAPDICLRLRQVVVAFQQVSRLFRQILQRLAEVAGAFRQVAGAFPLDLGSVPQSQGSAPVTPSNSFYNYNNACARFTNTVSCVQRSSSSLMFS